MTNKFHCGIWDENSIFVFGSNLAGRHGLGAAKYAVQQAGAIYYQGIGLQGDSYAIPTKDYSIKTLPLQEINWYVRDFITFAVAHPEKTFFVTAIGTGLAGYLHSEIAPMFKGVPDNCILPIQWREFV